MFCMTLESYSVVEKVCVLNIIIALTMMTTIKTKKLSLPSRVY